jgi:hypothetical protein
LDRQAANLRLNASRLSALRTGGFYLAAHPVNRFSTEPAVHACGSLGAIPAKPRLRLYADRVYAGLPEDQYHPRSTRRDGLSRRPRGAGSTRLRRTEMLSLGAAGSFLNCTPDCAWYHQCNEYCNEYNGLWRKECPLNHIDFALEITDVRNVPLIWPITRFDAANVDRKLRFSSTRAKVFRAAAPRPRSGGGRQAAAARDQQDRWFRQNEFRTAPACAGPAGRQGPMTMGRLAAAIFFKS